MSSLRSHPRSAFTLAELIVVIIIIAILIALLLPQVEKVRASAAMIQCQNTLKQFAFACGNYNSIHGHFPAGTVVGSAKEPGDRLGVMVELLPYLELAPLYQQFDLNKPWRSAANEKGVATWSRLFLCPASNQFGSQTANHTNYVGITGVGADAAALPLTDSRCGFFGDSRSVRTAHVKDGLANTLLFMETQRDLGPWAAGGSPTLRGIDTDEPQVGKDAPFGLHVPDRTLFRRPVSSAMAVMADGAAKKVPETVSASVLAALATIAGDDPVEINW